MSEGWINLFQESIEILGKLFYFALKDLIWSLIRNTEMMRRSPIAPNKRVFMRIYFSLEPIKNSN